MTGVDLQGFASSCYCSLSAVLQSLHRTTTSTTSAVAHRTPVRLLRVHEVSSIDEEINGMNLSLLHAHPS
jgi:hypothetical protein